MTFIEPERLILLFVVAATVFGYINVQHRRKNYALRFSSAELLDSVIPKVPRVRRHLPAAAYIAALTLLILAFAKPAAWMIQARERAIVVLAFDVSLSMEANDVNPTRLAAAKTAAITFVDSLPPRFDVALVTFAGTAFLEVPPTTDRLLVTRAIQNASLRSSTSIGSAIVASLQAIQNAKLEGTEPDIPSTIVLLSDGETQTGIPNSEAARLAIERNVPISTIAFGTARGRIEVVDEFGQTTSARVPPNKSALRNIASNTGGKFFEAASRDDLSKVYEDVATTISSEKVHKEIGDWFVGPGVVLLLAGGALSLLWFQRLP